MSKATKLEQVLAEFNMPGLVRRTYQGPVVETLLVELGAGVRVKRVQSLEDDIALRLGTSSVRIGGTASGENLLGIEVARAEPAMIRWQPPTSTTTLPMAVGVDTFGQRVTLDLARAPHVLVAGATGSGKSVAVHTMLCSLLFQPTPVRLVLVDPKRLEFRAYEGLSHLLRPVITDAMEATRVMTELVEGMEARYQELAKHRCRDIGEYHVKGGRMPYVVVAIDEWADLYSMQKDAIVNPVVRLAQKARAAGIHLILATQRPSVTVLPGVLKANFPARVALRVASKTDSRVVLDANGAERLIGRGDMLVAGFGLAEPTRLHGAFVDADKVIRG